MTETVEAVELQRTRRGVGGRDAAPVVVRGSGARGQLGEWEPDPRLVRPEELSEDILPVLKGIKAVG